MATDSGDGTELTTTQAAALAGVTEKTIRDWAKAGHILALRTPQGRRFDRDSLLAYLRTRSAQAVERVPREARLAGPPEPAPYHTTDSVPPSPTESVASPGTSTEPIETRFRVTPAEIERAVERTGARYLADLETILTRVGQVYEGQLEAKDETIAELRRRRDEDRERERQAQDEQRELLAELRRRAEVAEAARLAAEGERDALRLQLAEATVPPVVVVAAQDATETPPATIPTPTTAPGLWARLRRALGRT